MGKHNLDVHSSRDYYEWDRERFETEMYLQNQRHRLEFEQSYFHMGRSFAETNRHMNYYLDAYDYPEYDHPDYANYQDFADSGLNLSKPDTSAGFDSFWDDNRGLSPY